MNTKPSTPLCPNCLNTRLYCEAVRDIDRRKCCDECEHHELPADIRVL